MVKMLDRNSEKASIKSTEFTSLRQTVICWFGHEKKLLPGIHQFSWCLYPSWKEKDKCLLHQLQNRGQATNGSPWDDQ